MTARTKRKLNMLKRVYRFLADNPMTPAIPRATEALATVGAIISVLEFAAVQQTDGRGQAGSAVVARAFFARQIREQLKRINLTAREMEADTPGIRHKFRLPDTRNYTALKAAAQNTITEATPRSAEFVSFGLPASFLTDLSELLASFEAATGEKLGGVNKRRKGTAALDVKVKIGVAAATRLNACVRNHFRDRPEIIAAWAAARRVEAAPRRDDSARLLPSEDSSNGAPTVEPIEKIESGPSQSLQPAVSRHASPEFRVEVEQARESPTQRTGFFTTHHAAQAQDPEGGQRN